MLGCRILSLIGDERVFEVFAEADHDTIVRMKSPRNEHLSVIITENDSCMQI